MLVLREKMTSLKMVWTGHLWAPGLLSAKRFNTLGEILRYIAVTSFPDSDSGNIRGVALYDVEVWSIKSPPPETYAFGEKVG